MKISYVLTALLLATLSSQVNGASTPVNRDKLGEVIKILDTKADNDFIQRVSVPTITEEISADEMLAINRPALPFPSRPATTTMTQATKLDLLKPTHVPVVGKIAKPKTLTQSLPTTQLTTRRTSAHTGINQLKIGMSNYEVMSDKVMGKPKKVIRDIKKDGLSEVWEYSDNVTLTFVNNSLEKISHTKVVH